ncbi:MAG TPA: histidine kinase [Candidatus Limnocylindrales bacterium]|nr:histidine kinase [Candidatus Limnocylindrales bacterium]
MPAAPGSQFLAGDQVSAIDGRPLVAWADEAITRLLEPDPPPGTSVAFDVVRDGRSIRLDVALAPFPLGRFGSAPVGLLGFGAGVLLLSIVLLVRRPRSTALRLLFIGAAANAADIAAWSTALQPTDFRFGSPFLVAFGLAPAFNIVFWSTVVHILTIYPVRSPLSVRQPILVPLIYAAPLVAFAVLVAAARVGAPNSLVWLDRSASVVGLVASGMIVAILVATAAGYRRASAPVRRSVRWIAVTLVVAAVATLVLLTGPIALTGSPLLERTFVSLLALPVPIAIAAAVVRDRVFQVALLTRRQEQIVAAREDERRRLRRELHDGLAPTLAGAALKLDLARSVVRSDPAASEAAIDEARAAVRGTIQEIRRVSRELRPPTLDSLGLVGAIRAQAAALRSEGRSGAGPEILVEASSALAGLPAAVEIAAYRIAVEGMMNVIRHAVATTCRVRLELAGDELRIEVLDDGIGMRDEATGVGLRSMRERAAEVGGDVMIDERDGRGTVLLARLPVDRATLGPA